MFAAGYEVEAIKRRGRWLSSTFQQYLWRDQLIMSTIGRGMLLRAIRPVLGQNLGRAGGRSNHGKGKNRPNERMGDISWELVKLLRRRNMAEKQIDGFAPVNVVLKTHELDRLRTTTLPDLELIANGAWGQLAVSLRVRHNAK